MTSSAPAHASSLARTAGPPRPMMWPIPAAYADSRSETASSTTMHWPGSAWIFSAAAGTHPVAARQGLSESAFLKRLVERALAGTDSVSASVLPSTWRSRNSKFGVRWSALMDTCERGWIFEHNLAVPGPAHCSGPVRERLGFSVEDRLSPANADVRGVTRRAVGLPSRSYRCHAYLRGDKLFLSPIYVTSATDKLACTRRNAAETRRMESTGKIGIFVEQTPEKLDRRISVAPMMDWSDDRQTPLPISYL